MPPALSGWRWATHGHRWKQPISPGCSGEPSGRRRPTRSKRQVDRLPRGKFDSWLALALTVVSADIVGALQHGLDEVVAYTKERVQYGVPVGSFQAVQHLCAEALVAVEASSSTVKYAAWAVDELDPAEALVAARTAKAYSGITARTVAETIMQVYGGIGQTWEHIAHFVARRTYLDRSLFGDDALQLTGHRRCSLGGHRS